MEDLKIKVLVLILLIFAARMMFSNFHDPFRYKGPWYTLRKPFGWEMEETPTEILFKSPERDMLQGGMPEAIFSVVSTKPDQAIFLEDFFPEVLKQLEQEDGDLLDGGEIKIDKQLAKWTLFKNHHPPLVIMTFYMIDDFNRLTKIQYMATYKGFSKHRDRFEEFKDNFHFKKFF